MKRQNMLNCNKPQASEQQFQVDALLGQNRTTHEVSRVSRFNTMLFQMALSKIVSNLSFLSQSCQSCRYNMQIGFQSRARDSISRYVGRSVTLCFFRRLWYFCITAPAQMFGQPFYHCPCPPARDFGSRVSDLVLATSDPSLNLHKSREKINSKDGKRNADDLIVTPVSQLLIKHYKDFIYFTFI